MLDTVKSSAIRVVSWRPFRRPWFWVLAAIVLVLAVTAFVVLGRRDATAARIRQSGVWRVAMDPSFPPFESLDPATGQPVGLDVDLVNAIAGRWGVRAQIIGVGFDELVDAVAAHRVDSAVSALPVFEWRTKEVSFSTPYVEAGIVLAVRPDSSIRAPDDLAGRRVAAEWGSQGDAQARELQKRLDGELELVLRDSPDAALMAVERGEADAAIIDAISLALFNRDGGNLIVVGAPLVSDPYVVVVPAGARMLLGDVNKALEAMSADGTLAVLRRRWLGPSAP